MTLDPTDLLEECARLRGEVYRVRQSANEIMRRERHQHAEEMERLRAQAYAYRREAHQAITALRVVDEARALEDV